MYHMVVFFLLSGCFFAVSQETTLTTAKEIVDTSPKPIGMFRRIHVERNFEGTSKTPLDLFQLNKPERRSRNHKSVWNWDFWCQLQAKSGNCTAKGRTRTAFYYNAQLDQCSSFVFSGCHGNKNKFETLMDCERHCKGAIFMTLKEAARQGSCTLQPNSGLCMALLPRYYYDVNTESCKKFIYGGCGGNQNRFHTMEQCLNICKYNE